MLRRVLGALEAQALPPQTCFEVIIIDDGSTDGTRDYLAHYQARSFDFVFRAAGVNHGPARARNEGVTLAQGELVLFTGDDIVPERDFLAVHLEAHRRLADPRVAVLGRTIWPDDIPVTTVMRHIDGTGAQQFAYGQIRHGSFVDYRHFYTSNVSLPLALLHEESKLFDLDFPHAAYEDVEVSYRLCRRGMRIYYTRDALGYHYHPYTVYEFAERQYRAGLMACILAIKHPDTRRQVGVEDVERTERKGQCRIAATATRAWFENAGQLESVEIALLRLAAFYEFKHVPPLDELYRSIFQYFYDKGIADALREGEARDALRRRLLFADVAPTTDWFVREQARLGFPAPEDVLTWIASRHFIRDGAPRRPLWRRAAGRLKRALTEA
jgi:GT2 family glycosyltransferase